VVTTHLAVIPRGPHDLALAPVAVMVDRNLQLLRDCSPREIGVSLEIALNRPERSGSRSERAARVLETALVNVEMHGWHGEITGDNSRLRLSGGSVTLDLGLSASILHFIEAGPAAQRA